MQRHVLVDGNKTCPAGFHGMGIQAPSNSSILLFSHSSVKCYEAKYEMVVGKLDLLKI